MGFTNNVLLVNYGQRLLFGFAENQECTSTEDVKEKDESQEYPQEVKCPSILEILKTIINRNKIYSCSAFKVINTKLKIWYKKQQYQIRLTYNVYLKFEKSYMPSIIILA